NDERSRCDIPPERRLRAQADTGMQFMNFKSRSIRGNIRSAVLPFSVWLLCNLLAMGGLAVYQRAALLSELQAASFTLHREASQRAGQHDAHLTALSTIAQSKARTADVSQDDVFLEVAATITRF